MKKNVLLIIMINLTLFLTGCINIFHEHKFIINEVLPTCTEQGYIEEVCDCGEKNVKNRIKITIIVNKIFFHSISPYDYFSVMNLYL